MGEATQPGETTGDGSTDIGRTPAGAARSRARRPRLPQENREALIVEKAIRFFAACGFHGNTRDLARSIGISQPLLYHYFPSKQALIERIFDDLYSSRWKPEWEGWLRDRDQPLADRLGRFYVDYLRSVLTPEWTRIFFFAALGGVGIQQRNHQLVRERILHTILAELRPRTETVATATEEEIAWSLHARIFYLAVGEWVLALPSAIGIDAAIRLEIVLFLEGAATALAAGEGRR